MGNRATVSPFRTVADGGQFFFFCLSRGQPLPCCPPYCPLNSQPSTCRFTCAKHRWFCSSVGDSSKHKIQRSQRCGRSFQSRRRSLEAGPGVLSIEKPQGNMFFTEPLGVSLPQFHAKLCPIRLETPVRFVLPRIRTSIGCSGVLGFGVWGLERRYSIRGSLGFGIESQIPS